VRERASCIMHDSPILISPWSNLEFVVPQERVMHHHQVPPLRYSSTIAVTCAVLDTFDAVNSPVMRWTDGDQCLPPWHDVTSIIQFSAYPQSDVLILRSDGIHERYEPIMTSRVQHPSLTLIQMTGIRDAWPHQKVLIERADNRKVPDSMRWYTRFEFQAYAIFQNKCAMV
jgi:hypothetical protein